MTAPRLRSGRYGIHHQPLLQGARFNYPQISIQDVIDCQSSGSQRLLNIGLWSDTALNRSSNARRRLLGKLESRSRSRTLRLNRPKRTKFESKLSAFMPKGLACQSWNSRRLCITDLRKEVACRSCLPVSVTPSVHLAGSLSHRISWI